MTCNEPGCDKDTIARGMCTSHYNRWRAANRDQVRPKGYAEKFLLACANAISSRCIEWPFARHAKGYGHVRWGGQVRKAHRVVCEIVHGPAPSDRHEAAHNPIVCNNPSCVNPAHIRWALPVENSADREIAGTTARGARAGKTILTEEQVRIARTDPREPRDLAKEFGVAETTIRGIRARRSWKHVE
jgi:hypothetical protein